MNTIKNIYKNKRLAYMLPGVSMNSGGMYQYFQAWTNEFDDFPKEIFLISADAIKWKNKSSKFTLSNNYFKTKRFFISAISHHILKIRPFSFNFRGLIEFIEENKIDVIHIVSITIYADIIIEQLIKIKGLEIILTMHDPVPHDERRNFITKFLKSKSYQKIYKMAKEANNFFIHVHSKSILPESYKSKVEHFIFQQHPLPSPKVIRSRQTSPLNPGSSKFRLGFFGRIEQYKGLDNFYKAMLSISISNPELINRISIVIVGRGKFNKAEWLDLPYECIIENSFVEEYDFHQMIADLDLLILPYTNATQSGVAALGLSYKLPIIATAVGAIPELIKEKENCYILNNINYLDSQIVDILKNSEINSNIINSKH